MTSTPPRGLGDPSYRRKWKRSGSPGKGYLRLRGMTLASLLRLHEAAAAVGETWDFGVRDEGSLEHVVRLLNEKSIRKERRRPDPRESPVRIAAWIMHYIVATHPFWDANHRTGYLVARVVLRAFGLDVHASSEEAERFVRSIDGQDLTLESVEEWVRSHLVKRYWKSKTREL